MIGRQLCTPVGSALSMLAVTALLLIPGCYEEKVSSQGSTKKNPIQTTGATVKILPQRGKQKLAAPPDYAVFGMIYINSTDKREYIYDGAQWVPHDQTVDVYYGSADSRKARLPASEVFPTGPPLPTPTGAHGLPGTVPGGPTKHGGFDCKACHVVGGVFCFDPNGPAVATGQLLPSFDPTGKTCANIACHGMYTGTFYYYFPGGDGEPELKLVNYTGSGGSAPSWLTTGLGCTACHGNPPRNGAWHSGYHAGGITSASNQCQFCHPDATGSNGQGTAITNPAMHGDGSINVQATFSSTCFACH